MAKRKQQRMSKQELNAPDEVEVALNKAWDNLQKYRKAIIGGVVALLVLGVAMWIMDSMSQTAAAKQGDALNRATHALNGVVGPADPNRPDAPGVDRFADESSRLKTASAGLAAFLADYSGEDSAEPVKLAAANLKLAQGDAAAAITAADAWLTAYPDSALKSVALDLKARAAVASGDTAGAIAAYTTLAGATNGSLKAAALSHLGDLNNPALGGASAEAARGHYREALTTLGEDPDAEVDPLAGKPGLAGRVFTMLELLPAAAGK